MVTQLNKFRPFQAAYMVTQLNRFLYLSHRLLVVMAADCVRGTVRAVRRCPVVAQVAAMSAFRMPSSTVVSGMPAYLKGGG